MNKRNARGVCVSLISPDELQPSHSKMCKPLSTCELSLSAISRRDYNLMIVWDFSMNRLYVSVKMNTIARWVWSRREIIWNLSLSSSYVKWSVKVLVLFIVVNYATRYDANKWLITFQCSNLFSRSSFVFFSILDSSISSARVKKSERFEWNLSQPVDSSDNFFFF